MLDGVDVTMAQPQEHNGDTLKYIYISSRARFSLKPTPGGREVGRNNLKHSLIFRFGRFSSDRTTDAKNVFISFTAFHCGKNQNDKYCLDFRQKTAETHVSFDNREKH